MDIHSYGDEWIYPYASDSTEKKLKLRDNFYLYERVIQKLKSEGSVILSCWESLRYIADGVVAIWICSILTGQQTKAVFLLPTK